MQQKFVRMNELKGIVGLSRSSIYSMVKSDRFPKAKAIGARAKGWLLSEINEWMNQKSD